MTTFNLQNKQERYHISAVHINVNGVTLRSRRWCIQLILSAQLRAGGDGVADHYQIQLFLALLRVDGGQEHSVTLLAHHLPGRQVGDGDQCLAHQLLRLIVFRNAGEDLAVGAGAVVQGEAQQLVALLHRLAVLDLHRPQVGLAEGVEIHRFLAVRLNLKRRDGGLVQLLQRGQLLLHVDSGEQGGAGYGCLLYTSPSPRDCS